MMQRLSSVYHHGRVVWEWARWALNEKRGIVGEHVNKKIKKDPRKMSISNLINLEVMDTVSDISEMSYR